MSPLYCARWGLPPAASWSDLAVAMMRSMKSSRAADACVCYITEGAQQAMNRYNQKGREPAP